MSIQNLNDLHNAMTAYAHRTDAVPFYDLFVKGAEKRIDQHIRLKEMEKRCETKTIEQYVSLPDDLLFFKRVTIGGAEATFAESIQKIQKTDPANRCRYAIAFDNIQIAPAPDGTVENAVDVELIYYSSVQPLVNIDDFNVVLMEEPMVYLYAAMRELAIFVEDLEKAQVYEANFLQEAARLKEIYERVRWFGTMTRDYY